MSKVSFFTCRFFVCIAFSSCACGNSDIDDARAQVMLEKARMDIKIQVSRSFGAVGELACLSCLCEGGRKTDHSVFIHR